MSPPNELCWCEYEILTPDSLVSEKASWGDTTVSPRSGSASSRYVSFVSLLTRQDTIKKYQTTRSPRTGKESSGPLCTQFSYFSNACTLREVRYDPHCWSISPTRINTTSASTLYSPFRCQMVSAAPPRGLSRMLSPSSASHVGLLFSGRSV